MPDWKEEITRRLRSLKLAPAREAEIVEEMAQHLEDRYQELISGGATENEAARKALQELSDENLLARGLRPVEQEVSQEPVLPGGRGGASNFLASTRQDVGYGLRMLRRNPGFTTVAVMTVALGIGANTAIFSVIDSALLSPLPFPQPNRVVDIYASWPQFAKAPLSYPNFIDLQRENHSFQTVADWRIDWFTLTGSGDPERLAGQMVSADFLSVLGVHPVLGRSFRTDEDLSGRGTGGDAWRGYMEAPFWIESQHHRKNRYLEW